MTVATPPSDDAAAVLADLHALGVEVEVEGESLRLRGRRDALTPPMLDRLREHKPALLAMLTAERAADDDPPDAGIGWTPAEWRVLRDAGLTPGELPPLALDARRILADLGAVVVSVEDEPDAAPPSGGVAEHRREAASILTRARIMGRAFAIMLRDALHERLAICAIDGNMSDAAAWPVALAELREGVARAV